MELGLKAIAEWLVRVILLLETVQKGLKDRDKFNRFDKIMQLAEEKSFKISLQKPQENTQNKFQDNTLDNILKII